jgi:Leucine-rich repeat (LRR) protein
MIFEQNQFYGEIPASLANATNLTVIDLEYNSFHGIVPFMGPLRNLMELSLGTNQLESGDWSFLSSLANCTKLVTLDLSENRVQGRLPNSIGGLPNSLQFLLLSANDISGTIPSEIGHLTNLAVLHMESNQFTGSIPDAVGNLSNLFRLSLSQNKLSGRIPLSISNLSQLSYLYLQNNDFSGPIPDAFGDCKNLRMLNISCNNLDGGIPMQLLTLSSLSDGLDLSHNQLSGQIPPEIGGLINLGLLNISNNQLSGQIPPTLGQCVHLESLHMEWNLLEGKIPNSFAELRGIIELDLSRNNLSGAIPELFEFFGSLILLNLSFNSLQGPVPTGGIFRNKSAVYIQGNKNLCGSTPLLPLPLCDAMASRKNHGFKILKVLGFIALSLLLLACAVAIFLKKKKVRQAAHSSCRELKRFSYADIAKATNNFSSNNLIGSGKSGSVYKGRFDFEEHTVAIKVFEVNQLGVRKSFLAECETLRNTRHRNLVRVITACSTFDPSGHEFKALILEYMPNGSLESWLYPDQNNSGFKRSLSIGSRITIVMDIASALDYLHNHCMPPVVHCDLKPSNVLLDDDMGAHLADFGLAKFLQGSNHSCHQSSTSLLGPRGSIGYIAPGENFFPQNWTL